MSENPGYIGSTPEQADPDAFTVAGVLAGKPPLRLPHQRAGYENEPEPAEPQPMPRPEKPQPLKQRAPETPQTTVPEQTDGPPPKSGRGSTADAWAIYAAQRGVSVELDAKREDIIDACEKAGVPTE